MDPKYIIPALADLSQDIAGPIPVELIEAWVESEQSDADHARILEPYKRIGTMVSSDSAGLSKLSAGRPLIEVMKLVSEPKETIFSHGTAIGGKAVGIWAADNTQMFYDQSIDPNRVVEQMVAAQREIEKGLVQVGIGIHAGTAFEIGGGLYGVDVETIEEFTEEDSEGGEVIVSPTILSFLKAPYNQTDVVRGGMHVLDQTHIQPETSHAEDKFYPAPFDRAFHAALLALDVANKEDVERLHKERVRETSIVLFRVFNQDATRLLDSFTQKVAANTIIHGVCRKFDAKVVKSNGTLAIISCEKLGEGADLAMALQEAARTNDMEANVAVSRGDALVFDLENGFADLAGAPVNIASKLAEDTSERGKVFLEGVEAEHAERHGLTERFTIEKSGVVIQGIIG